MLIGPPSAQFITDKGGATIHRRRVKVLQLMCDMHCRIGDVDLGTACFNDVGYLTRLGQALNDFPDAVWDDFVAAVIRRITNQEPARCTRTPIAYCFPDDLVLYKHLLETEFCQTLRSMMSKSLKWCDNITLTVDSVDVNFFTEVICVAETHVIIFVIDPWPKIFF